MQKGCNYPKHKSSVATVLSLGMAGEYGAHSNQRILFSSFSKLSTQHVLEFLCKETSTRQNRLSENFISKAYYHYTKTLSVLSLNIKVMTFVEGITEKRG